MHRPDGLFAFAFPPRHPYFARHEIRVLLTMRATAAPAAPEWFHEIKYDGYRLRVERDGGRVRLITKAFTIGQSAFRALFKPR
jgi:hypothetical protein